MDYSALGASCGGWGGSRRRGWRKGASGPRFGGWAPGPGRQTAVTLGRPSGPCAVAGLAGKGIPHAWGSACVSPEGPPPDWPAHHRPMLRGAHQPVVRGRSHARGRRARRARPFCLSAPERGPPAGKCRGPVLAHGIPAELALRPPGGRPAFSDGRADATSPGDTREAIYHRGCSALSRCFVCGPVVERGAARMHDGPSACLCRDKAPSLPPARGGQRQMRGMHVWVCLRSSVGLLHATAGASD
ncbi:hypothetical protein H696_04174 [Fonticula alba]|uniref:Uncharacterized protein n=1 Tax=Fonticula alba TaxID=691883 RepID=A0A058Z665_FONAL|nr:hypothetical protein H696_04174 [Fonticula alba]KCV69765.1 hypothetical protein H696_04174 [Fonticula alba]|eukprot:XP_009496330.1 hypothetical protein H696_04174 [Fonticula alba]